jgi:uncharacterized integral membrane protein
MRRDDDMPEAGDGGSGSDHDPTGPGSSSDADRARRERLVKVLIGVLLVVLLVVFVSTNLDRTEVQFVFFSANIALIWVMLACALIGGVVGYLIGKPGRQIGRRKDGKPRTD